MQLPPPLFGETLIAVERSFGALRQPQDDMLDDVSHTSN